MKQELKPVVFDLDGTVRCAKHRVKYLPPFELMSDPRAFDKMNMECYKDDPIQDTIEVLRSLHERGHPVILLTRANEIAWDMTENWLREQDVPYAELIMADYEDVRGDREYKEEKIKYIEKKYGTILAFWDDQPKVCEHIRSLGYTCYHVVDPYPDMSHEQLQQQFN